jgi:hypothetical protein
MDLLLLALLAAMGVVGARWLTGALRRREVARVRRQTPGYTPDLPVQLASFKDLDAVVARARCACGGAVAVLGETSRHGLRVVRCRCVECEENVDLFVELPRLLH